VTDTVAGPGDLDDRRSSLPAAGAFMGVLAAGIVYAGVNLVKDLSIAPPVSMLPYVLLGVALLIALGFEFVNGFHDTANAVATVIYTNSLPPVVAVVWSGLWNFIGVLTSSGAVAFGIVSLLPVELILQVGSAAGFAMVFSLVIAAIVWNLGTWYLGLPSSSSHTLIGSIIGVGLMNQIMAPPGSAVSGVDWAQAGKIGQTLLISPLIGFFAAGLLLLAAKVFIRRPELYRAPDTGKTPPMWVRGLLVLTCTGVSFAHGSNDGQKGMGLIMLILIGTVPMAYGLNRALPAGAEPTFEQAAVVADRELARYDRAVAPVADMRATVTQFVRSKALTPDTVAAVRGLTRETAAAVAAHGTLAGVPPEMVNNVRNDMYLMSEALNGLAKSEKVGLDEPARTAVAHYKAAIDPGIKFIPDWVKVAVAIALGLGTMVGWKRIVVTVGEKIGKDHLTYGQGASAELVAMGTIMAADIYGLPVSTTHVLSSGVAGTMAANRSGLRLGTVRNMAMAWLLTLPASIALSASIFWILRQAF
jgi:inorganic phosphate transporter, PiT family